MSNISSEDRPYSQHVEDVAQPAIVDARPLPPRWTRSKSARASSAPHSINENQSSSLLLAAAISVASNTLPANKKKSTSHEFDKLLEEVINESVHPYKVEIEDLKTEIDRLSVENKSINNDQRQDTTFEHEELRWLVYDLQSENAELKATVKSMEIECANGVAEIISKYEKNIEKMRVTHSDKASKLADLELKSPQVQPQEYAEVYHLRTEHEKQLSEQNQKYEAELLQNDEVIKATGTKASRYDALRTFAIGMFKVLREEKAGLTKELEKARTQLATAKARVDHHVSLIQGLSRQRFCDLDHIDKLTRKNQCQAQEIEHVEMQIENLQGSIKVFTEDCSSKDSEILQLKGRVEQAQVEATHYMAQLEEYSQKLRQVERLKLVLISCRSEFDVQYAKRRESEAREAALRNKYNLERTQRAQDIDMIEKYYGDHCVKSLAQINDLKNEKHNLNELVDSLMELQNLQKEEIEEQSREFNKQITHLGTAKRNLMEDLAMANECFNETLAEKEHQIHELVHAVKKLSEMNDHLQDGIELVEAPAEEIEKEQEEEEFEVIHEYEGASDSASESAFHSASCSVLS